jgi:SAM-dependent methyltransferase
VLALAALGPPSLAQTPSEYMGRPIAQTMHWRGADWLERETRESEEHTSRMLAALELEPGMVVCDLGCGVGTIALPMARTVAPGGRVLAVDIQQEMLDGLAQRAQAAGLANIERILGGEADPRLAPSSCDLVLMVDVYHELSWPAELLAAVRVALKPDGRLVLVEFRAEDEAVPIKPEHKMTRAQVERELDANGFRLARSFDALPWQHMLFFARDDAPGIDEARPAVAGVLGALARHELVLFGEDHGIRESHAVLQALLAEPRLGTLVDDVVVEFGNPRHQAVVDRYVAGAEVDPAELARAWRDTAVPLAWDSPLYAEFFAGVRAANAGRPAAEQLRLVLGEAAIDWESVRTPADYGAFADRSGLFAATVEREVLARGRRALLVIGGMHVLRRDARNAFADELPRAPGVGQWLALRYPGKSLALWSVPATNALGARGAGWPTPAFVPLAGRALGAEGFGLVAPQGVQVQRVVAGQKTEQPSWVPLTSDAWPPLERMADALLHLGPVRTQVPPPDELFLDADRVAELRRRCELVDAFYGFDLYASGLEQRLAEVATRRNAGLRGSK